MAKAIQAKLPQANHPVPNPTVPNHREKIMEYLAVLKMKLKAEQLEAFLQEHAQGTLSILDPPLTMALLDRALDRVIPITFTGESVRGEALRNLKKKSAK